MAIKLLIGGSPCTHWSIAQKNNRETEPVGEGWELFENYFIAKEKFKPDFFLYENNKSASQAIKDEIAKDLGVGTDPSVRFTYINSALVSAQNRQRFYVTNFGDIEQPADRGILLKDILETGVCESARIPEYGNVDKSRPVRASYAYKGSGEGSLVTEAFPEKPNKQVSDYVAEPVRVGSLPRPNGELSQSQAFRIYDVEGKSVNINAGGGGAGGKTGLYAIPVETDIVPFVEAKLDDAVKKYGYIPEVWNPYNNAEITDKAPTQTAQCASQTKSSTVLSFCNLGYATPIEWDENGRPTKAVSGADGKTYTVYEVKDGIITIKGKEYPIKLADGFYIIRKLTVTECCRLQTLPDNYCKAVSDSQAYKGLGNGWTAEVIIHLLNHALKDVPRDEELIVLSMYDGIGTGRYCLDKMGFTNIKYYAYEIDKYPIAIAMDNYPDIIQCGDAFAVREEDWEIHSKR